MKILSFVPKTNAVFTYRCVRPLRPLGATFRKTLLRKNEKIQLKELGKRLRKLGDIWVIKYLKNLHTADILITLAKETGAKLVLDIDDNIWQIPIGNIVRHSEGFDKYVALNTGLVEHADWVTVSTEPMKQALLPLNSNIEVLPNLIDPKEWKFKRKKHKKIRIGWIWFPTHVPDMPIVKEALEEIYTYDNVEIVMFGALKNMMSFPATNINGVKFEDYPRVLTEAGIDISICPLADNDFSKCKSNIKWLESTLAGAAVVASKVYPYEFSIEHGKTGYLAQNTNQWIKYLFYLIENPDKRLEMQQNAFHEVLKYDVAKDTKWHDFYSKCVL